MAKRLLTLFFIFISSIANAQSYTTPGTYIVNWPTNSVGVKIQVWGGGGGGGIPLTSSQVGSAGGGGGGYSQVSMLYRTDDTHLTVEVGAGGLGGSVLGDDGQTGESSYVYEGDSPELIYCRAWGGSGAEGAFAGHPGISGGGSINKDGGWGGHPIGGSQPARGGSGGGGSGGNLSNGNAGGNALPGSTGAAGATAVAIGGAGGAGGNINNDGVSGSTPGGGGGGCGYGGLFSGNGAHGKVVLTFYYEL